MENEKIQLLFTYLDETATFLEEHWSITYLEGIAEAGENLFRGEVCQPLQDDLKESLAKKLSEVIDEKFQAEEVRKAFQLVILKGMKGSVQPHHSMTPDAVSLFMSYLVNKVTEDKEKVTLVDLAVGSGNLIHTLLNQSTRSMSAIGYEVDETLLKLAYVSSNLQKNELELFHQDSIEPILLKDIDLVVTDVAAGYYPKDDVATSYQLKREEGHSYLHYLMIEQGINITKEGGYLFFIVPNYIFEGDDVASFYSFVKEKTNVIGLLQLPESMFQDKRYAKGILMLQKKAEWVKQPQQALLAELPSFTNKQALSQIIQKMNEWFENFLKK